MNAWGRVVNSVPPFATASCVFTVNTPTQPPMNIHPSGNTWPFALGPSSQEALQTAKHLIDIDEGDELEAFEQMLEDQLVSGTTPSGGGSDNLLMYAVQKAALFSFSAMVSTLGEDASVGLNHQNLDKNTVWHLMAIHLSDGNFSESGGWFNVVDKLLDDLPGLSIDWSLRNNLNETALETARQLGKDHLANWLEMRGAGHANPPMDIDGE